MKNQKSATFEKKIEHKYTNDKKYLKVNKHRHYTGKKRVVPHIICNLKCSIPKEIPVVFHNGNMIIILS